MPATTAPELVPNAQPAQYAPGQFMGGSASDYYVPPPIPATPIQGTGGYVSPGAQFISGLEAGSNFMGNLQQSARGRAAYNANIAGAQRSADYSQHLINADRARRGLAPQQALQFSDFSQMPGTRLFKMLGRGVSDVAGRVAGMFGHGAPGASPGVVGPVGTLANGQAEFPQPGQTWNNGAGNTTTQMEGGGVVPASTQGQMPPMWAPGAGSRAFMTGGVVGAAPAMPSGDAMPTIPQSFGAPVPASAGAPGGDGSNVPPAPIAAAMMATLAQGHQPPVVPAPQSGGPAPTPGAEPAHGALPPPAQAGLAAAQMHPDLVQKVETWAHHLFHGGAMQGVGRKGAIPANPNAPAPGSLASAGPAHSLTPEWFDQGTPSPFGPHRLQPSRGRTRGRCIRV